MTIIPASALEAPAGPAPLARDDLRGRSALADLQREREWEEAFARASASWATVIGAVGDGNRCSAEARGR